MVFILTSSGNPVEVSIRTSNARLNEPSSSARLHASLDKKLTKENFQEQQIYINDAALAAYVSLNTIDQNNRFMSTIKYEGDELNFIKGSSSSGLANTLALFNSYWTKLRKGSGFAAPVFATGEINRNGAVLPIGHVDSKLKSVLNFVTENNIPHFFVCLPKENKKDISSELMHRLRSQGGQILAKDKVQEILLALLGDEYDGDPLGRWKPFKGLDSFEYRDSSRFFGRKNDIERIVTDLNSNSSILIVTGATGSGKSSLIKAGLIPFLKQNNSCDYWISSTPKKLEDNTLLGLTVELFTQHIDQISDEKKIEITKQLRKKDKNLTTKILSELQAFNYSYLINIDQFEQLFTSSNNQQILDDLKILKTFLELSNDIKLVISLRTEYLADILDLGLVESPTISNVPSKLSTESWTEIVLQQAYISGLHFEKDASSSLDQLIIDEAVNVENALPMVQFLLEQLYEKAQSRLSNKDTLRIIDFHEFGGLSGAIANRAEDAVRASGASVEIVHRFFSLFVNVNNEGLAYSKPIEVDKNFLDEGLKKLISDLNEVNILTKEISERGTLSYRFTHDSLFTSWPQLKNWIEKQSLFLAWKNSTDRRFRNWQSSNNQSDRKIFLLGDATIIKEGLAFIEQGLIWDKHSISFVSQSKRHQDFNRYLNLSFFVIAMLFTAFLFKTVFNDFNMKVPVVEMNTKTWVVGDKNLPKLELSVAHSGQAKDLYNQLKNLPELKVNYGRLKISWGTLEDSYDNEKLFTGALGLIRLSASSQSDFNIVKTSKFYTLIAKDPEYSSCLFHRDNDRVLQKEQIQLLKVGLGSQTYSISSFQRPYMYLLENEVDFSSKRYFSRGDMKKALLNKEIDLYGNFCPYNENEIKKLKSANIQYQVIGEKIEGTGWYVSSRVKLPGFKCLVADLITSWKKQTVRSKGKSDYFANTEIFAQQECQK